MQDPSIQPAPNQTELGQALDQLNKDTVDEKTHLSAIDMRTRLGNGEIASILTIDALVSMGALPRECLKLTQQKKRLAISRGGQGRREIVGIVQGKQEREDNSGKNLFQWMGGFGGGENK